VGEAEPATQHVARPCAQAKGTAGRIDAEDLRAAEAAVIAERRDRPVKSRGIIRQNVASCTHRVSKQSADPEKCNDELPTKNYQSTITER
jgi:hypothetical protein